MAGVWRGRARGGAATRKKPISGRANEDTVLCRAVDGVIGVFDGIGAYSEARLASQIARQRCTPLLRAIDRARYATVDDALMAMGRAVLAAQDGVIDLQQRFPQAGDGGTTATIAKLWQAAPNAPVQALYVNIGDSRLYHWHVRTRRLERLTSDDNVVRQWRELGWIDDATVDALATLMDAYTGTFPLPPAAREAWEQRNTICAWLGMPEISFMTGVSLMLPGDRLIATSDGIHDNLTNDELAGIVRQGNDPRAIALHLIDVADAIAMTDNSARSKPDDMSAAVLILDAVVPRAADGEPDDAPEAASA